MTADELAAIAGLIASLCFSYIPGLFDWYDPLEPTKKRLIMGAVILAVACGAFGLSCAGLLESVTCTQAGAMGLLSALISALVANQAIYQLTPRRS